MKILLVTPYKNIIATNTTPTDIIFINHYNRYHKKIYETLFCNNHDVILCNGLEENLSNYVKNADIVFPIRSNYPTPLYELNIILQAERFQKKIIGSSVASKMIECDKIASKLLVNNLGISTPKFYSFFDFNQLEIGKKYIIKKRYASSSIGIEDNSVFIYDDHNFPKQISDIKNKELFFIEEFIEGIDISIGVVFSKNHKHLLSKPYTMKSLSSDVVTFEQKKNGKNLVCDFSNNHVINKKLEEYAIKIFNHIQPCEYTRIDFILSNNGELFFLEYNNTPNLSCANYYVSSLIEKYFTDYSDFINYLLSQALQLDI